MMPYNRLPPGRSRIHIPFFAVVVGGLGAIILLIIAGMWGIIKIYGWLTS